MCVSVQRISWLKYPLFHCRANGDPRVRPEIPVCMGLRWFSMSVMYSRVHQEHAVPVYIHTNYTSSQHATPCEEQDTEHLIFVVLWLCVMVDFISESFSYLQGNKGSRGTRGNRVRRFRSCSEPRPLAGELTLTLCTTVHYVLLSKCLFNFSLKWTFWIFPPFLLLCTFSDVGCMQFVHLTEVTCTYYTHTLCVVCSTSTTVAGHHCKGNSDYIISWNRKIGHQNPA